MSRNYLTTHCSLTGMGARSHVTMYTSMDFMPARSHVAVYHEAPRLFGYECLHCGTYMQWRDIDAPPNKCRSCGAPRKLK